MAIDSKVYIALFITINTFLSVVVQCHINDEVESVVEASRRFVQRNEVPLSFSSEVKNISMCPTWTFAKDNGECECGNSDNYGRTVKCDFAKKELSILPCYCLSEYGETLSVGRTIYACRPGYPKMYNSISWNVSISTLDRVMCEPLNRTGTLCGKCINDSFALPAYSYNLECVECTDYRLNWLKYLGVAFLPLTVFYIAMVLFRVPIATGMMNCCVFVFQILSTPIFLREAYVTIKLTKSNQKYLVLFKVLMSFFGIWNLDFFRILYSPFCLHPKMSVLKILAMDYVIALYPFLLILLTYIMVKIHDNFRIAVILWSPVTRCFVSIRRNWNIKTSLISVFVSFVQLSYVKILSVSCDLLLMSFLHNVKAELAGTVLFYDGTIKYFSSEHLPFAVLAISMIITCGVLPLILFCLYPCQCFQRFLNCCGLRCQLLHILMDTVYQDYYKKSCRHFAIMYLVLRGANIIIFSAFATYDCLFFSGLIFLVASVLIATVKPYRVQYHNLSDTFLLLMLSFLFLMAPLYIILNEFNFWYRRIPIGLGGIFSMLICIQSLAILIYYCFPKKIFLKIISPVFSKCPLKRNSNSDENVESLPHRLLSVNSERSPLLIGK